MKKFLLILVILLCASVTTHAETIQHRVKTPSFFVPKGTFENNNQKQSVTSKTITPTAKKQVIVGKPQIAAKAKTQPQIAPMKIQKQVPIQTPSHRENPQPTEPLKTVASAAAPQTAHPASVPNIPADSFQFIFAEYQHDTELLAKGQTLNNQRLKKVLADFKNQERQL